jgi:hypothetical protein
MVYPKKKLTAYAAAGGQPPLDSASEDMKNADVAAAPRGFDLLFAASQVETKPKQADANGAEDPSTSTIIRVVSVSNNGTATAEGEPGSSCDAKEDFSHEFDAVSSEPAADTIKKQAKIFPQVLQEILTTPEYQSIAHWLPDGLSFVIADKQRFSGEILPKYFREAQFHSFIRKLNRWGFRRVKSRDKGEESSFAHINFVREKPWLCLKMRCKSKPTYHKVSSAKKNAHATISLANTARISVRAQASPSSLAAGGMVSRGRAAFVPACLPTTSTFPTATAAGSPAATTIQERQYHTSISYEHQQRIFRERQILMFQMRQKRQLKVELQRRNEMSSHNEEQISNTEFHDGAV